MHEHRLTQSVFFLRGVAKQHLKIAALLHKEIHAAVVSVYQHENPGNARLPTVADLFQRRVFCLQL